MPFKNSGFATLRRTVIAVVATTTVLVSSTGALAWSLPPSLSDNTGAINFWNNCGISGANGIWAADGDVVTTTKWNQFVCRFQQTLNVLYDWGRNKTPFLSVQSNTLASQSGSYVNGLRLADTGGGGAINFYDSNSAFALGAPQNALGSIRYTNGAKEGLHLTSNNGPVYIDTVNNTAANSSANDETNGNKQYPLGWVGISLMDQTEFDSMCMYRVITNHLHVIYMTAVNGGYIRAYLDANHDANLGQPGRIGVAKENKTELQNSITVGESTPTANYGTWVSAIEKLCLPRYYEADTNVHYYQWNGANYSEYMTIKKNMN